jgi:hypothetical protein
LQTRWPARISRDDRAGRYGFRHDRADVKERPTPDAQRFLGMTVHDHGTCTDRDGVLDDDVAGADGRKRAALGGDTLVRSAIARRSNGTSAVTILGISRRRSRHVAWLTTGMPSSADSRAVSSTYATISNPRAAAKPPTVTLRRRPRWTTTGCSTGIARTFRLRRADLRRLPQRAPRGMRAGNPAVNLRWLAALRSMWPAASGARRSKARCWRPLARHVGSFTRASNYALLYQARRS